MASDPDHLRRVVREAARLAFEAVRASRPDESFYYFALVTTGDGLRPGPSASSEEGLGRVLEGYRANGQDLAPAELRWSEADSPYDLFGDEFFGPVTEAFSGAGDHRGWPPEEYREEVGLRFAAMEGALRDLDQEGFFGRGPARAAVVINVVAPGDEDEAAILARAARLNPAEALAVLVQDLGDP